MKKIKTILACAMLVVFASCSNDTDSPSVDDNVIRLYSSVGGITTKAAANLYTTTNNFETNALVNVYIRENTTGTAAYTYGTNGLVVCKANGSGALNPNDGTTNYFPANGNGVDVYGIYPTSIKESTTPQPFSVSTNQSYDNDYKASDLMFASLLPNKKKGTPISLSFAHKLSKVIVKLEAGDGLQNSELHNAIVEINNTYPGCSIATVDKNGFGTIAATGSTADITVGKWTTGSSGIAAIVVPQTVTKGKALFKVTLSNGATYTYTIPNGGSDSDVTFAEGKVQTYTLTLRTADISVTSTIKDWTPETTESSGNAELDTNS